MFVSFLDWGLAFLLSEFFRHFLAFYGIQVHELMPKSILHLSCFVILCEAFLGCLPYFPLWIQILNGKLAA